MAGDFNTVSNVKERKGIFVGSMNSKMVGFNQFLEIVNLVCIP